MYINKTRKGNEKEGSRKEGDRVGNLSARTVEEVRMRNTFAQLHQRVHQLVKCLALLLIALHKEL